jgi:hypothetical protein
VRLHGKKLQNATNKFDGVKLFTKDMDGPEFSVFDWFCFIPKDNNV